MEFLWLFLPCVFIGSRLLPKKAVNGWLLLSSLLFYTFGEPVYIVLMLVSISFNYTAGFCIDAARGLWRRVFLTVSLCVNIALLGYFKYFDFAALMLKAVTGRTVLSLRNIALPIGISFFTFQIMSYIIDLYRKKVKLQKNPFKLALYISFFPQLIAGPIVNYGDIEHQISERNFTPADTAYGIKRFIWGLSKKALIANTLAAAADGILAVELNELASGYIWLAYLFYALQIYYDFSGYSDMAIGLGRMFGFKFRENFNYPYLSRSITEFWRRWHISLSDWFRLNVYFPLGGNRKGKARTIINMFIVFALTGLWHGAGLNFIVWGLWHWLFITVERIFSNKNALYKPFRYLLSSIFRRVATLLVVYFGWVFFRAGSITAAVNTIVRMFSFSKGNPNFYFQTVGSPVTILAAITALAGSGLLQSIFPKLKYSLFDETKTGLLHISVLIFLFILSVTTITIGSYNPFIYFRF